MPVNRMVFIHSSDERYGADRMLLEQLHGLPVGVDAEVWVPTDLAHPAAPLCTEVERLGVPVRHADLPIVRRAYRSGRGLTALARRTLLLLPELRRARAEVVYCTTSATFLAAPVARLIGTPVVLGQVQEIWTGGDRRLLAAPAGACHRLLAISGAVAAELPARLRARTRVVPNGTPDPGPPKPLDGRSGELTFLVASRWNGWKGHATLLRAWDRLVSGRLLVLGGPPPSGAATDVPRLVSELRRPDSVTIVGEVDDPARYLDMADVVVVPSERPEPFGLVAIEAFARGRPVIATSAGGLLEIVRDGVDGWLVPPGDVAALAGRMAGLGRADVIGAGRAAREGYERRFTREIYLDRWRGWVRESMR